MRTSAVALGLALASLAASAFAAEDWVAVERSIAVNASPEKVWSNIGGYCQANKNRNAPCDFLKGTGGLGTNRKVGGGEEVKVAEGVYSYGYFQTVGANTPLRYHGNISVVPDGARSRIVYTLIYDQGALKDDAERASTATTMGTRFQGAIEQMKTFVEAAN